VSDVISVTGLEMHYSGCDALRGVDLNVRSGTVFALLGENEATLDSLLRAADTAMYAAKDAGRNTYQIYSDSFYDKVRRRVTLEQELRGALARDELSLVYQPTVKSSDGSVTGVEALLRWRPADGELRSPVEFIPIAEETGEIVAIGQWVLEQACRQAAAWHAKGLAFGRMAVNVSAVQLRRPEFAAEVVAIARRCGWPTLPRAGPLPSTLRPMLRRWQHPQRLAGVERQEHRRRQPEQYIARNRPVQRSCVGHHQHSCSAQ
jgi:predicted signal transduction protein with EAL and GGDEF domain